MNQAVESTAVSPAQVTDSPTPGPRAPPLSFQNGAPENSFHSQSAQRSLYSFRPSRASSRFSCTPRSEIAESLTEEEIANLNRKQASIVMAARYRSAQRSSSIRREMSAKGPQLQSRNALSIGEEAAMERMMEKELHRQEVLNRAAAIKEQCELVILEENLEKAKQEHARLKDKFVKVNEERAARSISVWERHRQNQMRRREAQRLKEEKIRAEIQHREIRTDPFNYIAIRDRYQRPTECTTPRVSQKKPELASLEKKRPQWRG